jgi:hypothetical protein
VCAAYHQRHPETHHVDAGLHDPPDVEELRLAERAMVMVNRHLDNVETGVVDFLHQLEADDAARLFEMNPVEHRSTQQADG